MHKTVRVRGIGFNDFAQGQSGRPESCIESHAVIEIN